MAIFLNQFSEVKFARHSLQIDFYSSFYLELINFLSIKKKQKIFPELSEIFKNIYPKNLSIFSFYRDSSTHNFVFFKIEYAYKLRVNPATNTSQNESSSTEYN